MSYSGISPCGQYGDYDPQQNDECGLHDDHCIAYPDLLLILGDDEFGFTCVVFTLPSRDMIFESPQLYRRPH